uniref:CLIP domain-containing serine protease n=1 Tax=Manduca sexta TaxID=7130 RepID=Q2FAY5_MANSE|nr:prophenoloxidase activating proteinase-2 [Manduca sexta]
MNIVLALCVFAVSASFASGQACTLPNNDKGTCKSLLQCDVASKIISKKPRTAQDEKFLRESACGFDGQTPKVCCPESDTLSCLTPDNKPGKCVNIKKCTHLAEIEEDPIGEDETTYLKNSVCAGPEDNSVCCGPPLPTKFGEVNTKTTCEQSAFPPDPDSDCCGLDSSFDNKILGGEATAIDQYPWLALIEYHKLAEIKLMCGGSLISAKYVLTAAHCVKGPILEKGTPKNVRLGEYNTTNNGPDCVPSDAGSQDCTEGMVLAPIEQTIPHPEYKPYSLNKQHDIALIRLRTFAPRTDFISPICLPKIDYAQSPPSAFSLYVAGWGRYIQDVEAGIYRSSKIKLHVNVPFVDNERCLGGVRKLRNGENISLWKGQLCAGGVSGKDSCKGDSGGPLMYDKERKYEAVGVVSYGAEICGQQGIPGVYTNVHEYLPWIKATIKA